MAPGLIPCPAFYEYGSHERVLAVAAAPSPVERQADQFVHRPLVVAAGSHRAELKVPSPIRGQTLACRSNTGKGGVRSF